MKKYDISFEKWTKIGPKLVKKKAEKLIAADSP